MTVERFGMTEETDTQYIEFGEWGKLTMLAMLGLFEIAHLFFDSEESRNRKASRMEYASTCKQWYEGYHPKPLKIKSGDYDDNILVNYCRPLIDDGVSWLWGRRETGVVGIRPIRNGVEEGENEQITGALATILKNSGGFNMLKKWGMRGSIAGHSYLKILVKEGIEVKSLTPEDVSIVVLDPMLMDLRTDPTNEDQITAYSIQWNKEEKNSGGGIDKMVYRQLIIDVAGDGSAWAIGDFKSKDRLRKEWQVVGGPWAWPWPWSPIVSGPNIEAPWGVFGYSDLEDITGLNSGINTAVSNYGKILRHHAHPKTVGTGFSAKEVEGTEIGTLWTVTNPEAKIKNLEMQTDLRSSLTFIGMLSGAFWNIGRGLDQAAYQQNVTNVTNFGLRVLALKPLEKMEDKRGTYGAMLREVIVRSLEAAGIKIDEVRIEWPDPLPNNPTAVVDKLEKEIGMGLTSRETASTELGRTWDVEKERIVAEAKDLETLGEMFMKEFDRGAEGGASAQEK